MPPALIPAIAVLTGCVVGTFADIPFGELLRMLLLLCAGAAVSWWRSGARSSFFLTVLAFAIAAAIVAGDARQQAVHTSLRSVLDEHVGGLLIDDLGPENDHDPIPVRAVLCEDAAVRSDYVSLRAEVVAVQPGSREWLTVDGGVTFTVTGEAASSHVDRWRAGRLIEAAATFRRPARYLNDGVVDFERRLALDGTTLFGSIKSAYLIDVLARGSARQEWAADVRAHVRRAVTAWVAPHDATAAAIVTAVLIGDRTGLADEVNDRLQRAGTYHVIAISGGNIAILAGVTLGLLVIVGVHGRAAAMVTVIVLLGYAQVATSGPSVWRATVMAVVYLTARLLDHRTPPWQATAVAAGAMALASPLDVRSPGFILTFGATGALLESAARMKTFVRKYRALAWIAASVGASIAVEIVLMPVSARSFARVTLAGPLLNLLAVPLMAVVQIAGLLVSAFDAWAGIARPAGWLASLAASAIVESARVVDAAPALSWRVPSPGVPLLVIYYGSLLAALFLRRARWRAAAGVVCAAALLGVVGVGRPLNPQPVEGLRVTVLDVGQGEAMVLESGGSRLQIDAGGAPFGGGGFDIGARVVAPSLWARGIARLDAVLLTHGDPDHIGGAPFLFAAFAPRQMWEGIVVPRHESSRELRAAAAAVGATVSTRRAGELFEWGRARIRVLHPPEPDWERPRVRNDDSVVLEVTCGDVAVLLTGDIGADVERVIVPQLTAAGTRVLKVAHHGSRTSSSGALLEGWRPQIALISAGRGNTFGHPAPEVIERLESIGAQIYRTDRHGEITVDSDCTSVSVRTFTGEEP